MNQFHNRLEINYYNLLLAKDNVLREKILHNIFNMIRYYPIHCTDSIYKRNKEEFIKYLESSNQQYLILLTFDLHAISKFVGFNIAFYNHQFYIVEDQYNDENTDIKWGEI